MATTFTKIADYTVGSGGAATIDFTSIPSTYTDLVLKLSARHSVGNITGYCTVAFNNSTSSFSIRGLYGAGGGTPGSFTSPSNYAGEVVGDSSTSSTFANFEMYIPNYAGSTNKSYSVDSVAENNGTTAQAAFTAGLWSNTSAINRITLTPNAGSFVQYTTATLYGVKNA